MGLHQQFYLLVVRNVHMPPQIPTRYLALSFPHISPHELTRARIQEPVIARVSVRLLA